MNYSKSRAVKQLAASGLKTRKIEPGTKLVMETIEAQETVVNGQTRITDFAMCVSEKGRVRVPIAELLKMKKKDGKVVFSAENGNENVQLPDIFTIESSEDRKDRNGNVVYPLRAYALADAFTKGEIKTWAELIAGGPAENHGLDPVQDYVISF